MSSEYMTSKQASEYLNLHESYLPKQRHYGTGPRFYRISPKAIRYLKSDLDDWMAEKIATATTEYAGEVA